MVIWWIISVILSCLFWINSYLLGRYSGTIAGFFAMLLFGWVGVSFWWFGWKLGILCFLGAWIVASIVRGPCEYVAKRKIMGWGK